MVSVPIRTTSTVSAKSDQPNLKLIRIHLTGNCPGCPTLGCRFSSYRRTTFCYFIMAKLKNFQAIKYQMQHQNCMLYSEVMSGPKWLYNNRCITTKHSTHFYPGKTKPTSSVFMPKYMVVIVKAIIIIICYNSKVVFLC